MTLFFGGEKKVGGIPEMWWHWSTCSRYPSLCGCRGFSALTLGEGSRQSDFLASAPSGIADPGRELGTKVLFV